MSTYVFGDIQGCFREMKYLLDKVDFDGNVDNLWYVGDLVNRGPDNLKTIRFIMSLGDSVVSVLGNHDLHFLAVATGSHKPVKRDTIADLLEAPDLNEIIEWMRRLPLLHFDRHRNLVLVHAGLHPQWGIKYALKRAKEVESILQGKYYRHFLKKMYGNKPDRWRDDLSGMKRLRVITNYFTRLRYCKNNGRLELNHKANIVPKGFKPWFEHDRGKHKELTILFGHWASLGGKVHGENLYALDTGCVWGRKLTMLRLEDMCRFSCPSMEELAF